MNNPTPMPSRPLWGLIVLTCIVLILVTYMVYSSTTAKDTCSPECCNNHKQPRRDVVATSAAQDVAGATSADVAGMAEAIQAFEADAAQAAQAQSLDFSLFNIPGATNLGNLDEGEDYDSDEDYDSGEDSELGEGEGEDVGDQGLQQNHSDLGEDEDLAQQKLDELAFKMLKIQLTKKLNVIIRRNRMLMSTFKNTNNKVRKNIMKQCLNHHSDTKDKPWRDRLSCAWVNHEDKIKNVECINFTKPNDDYKRTVNRINAINTLTKSQTAFLLNLAGNIKSLSTQQKVMKGKLTQWQNARQVGGNWGVRGDKCIEQVKKCSTVDNNVCA